MKYPSINQQLFIENRKQFTAQMKPNSIAIFTSNYEYLWNGDADYKFKQNSNLFWLSGIDQENTVLVLFPDAPNSNFKEQLFITETNEHIAVWYGHKYTKDEASHTSGISIKHIHWNQNWFEKLRSVINLATHIYLPLNENDRYTYKSPYAELDLAHQIIKSFPAHQIERATPILQRLRSIKHPIEIELMNNAIEISKKGFLRLLNFVKPGVGEYEIEAELIHEYISNKAIGHSFHPIVASGASACVLHYIDNNKACNDGELVLVDCGVDYANYSSDMTRVIPVNGKFTKRQKEVYNSVLHVMRESTKLLKPGTLWTEYQAQSGLIMQEELLKLGLITIEDIKNQDSDYPAYKKYFMHGTSHFLGIEVHDVGMRYEPMQAGMIFTCEPGIYIKEEGIGIRIENNILITNDKPFDLMDAINMPIEVDEIEALMAK